MAIRRFTAASSEFLTFAPGSVANMDGGPVTIAHVWRATTVHAGSLIYAIHSAGNKAWATNPFSDGSTWAGATSSSGGALAYLAANWYLTAFTKAEGNQPWRKHQINLTTPAGWTHANGSSSTDSVNVPFTRIEVGRNAFGSEYLNGDLGVIGVWDSALSDLSVEALATGGLKTWIGAMPRILLPFNQANVAREVKCLMGSGVVQTARTGTTVVAEEPTGFSMDTAPGASGMGMTDNMVAGLRSLYPDSNEDGQALLQRWKVDNGKTGWDAYVTEMHAFCAFFGQPQAHFIDAQDRTWALIDFFN